LADATLPVGVKFSAHYPIISKIAGARLVKDNDDTKIFRQFLSENRNRPYNVFSPRKGVETEMLTQESRAKRAAPQDIAMQRMLHRGRSDSNALETFLLSLTRGKIFLFESLVTL
jgi:hypothetical protein